MPLAPPPGSVFCIFCKGVVPVKDDDLYKFKNHMRSVHDIFYEYDIILSLHFLTDSEKIQLHDITRQRVKHGSVPAFETETETLRIQSQFRD